MQRYKFFTVFCLAAVHGVAQSRLIAVPSLTATVEDTFVRGLSGGNSISKTITGQFYRDKQGRTRIERGPLVTIQDPTTKTTIVIDTSSNTGRRFTATQSNPSGPSMSAVTGKESTHQDLGIQVLSGVAVKGVQFTVVLPPGAVGNLGPLTQTSEIWRSEALALTVETKSMDPINGVHTQLFSNITNGADVDPGLFTIPAGMQVVDVQPTPHSGSQKMH